MDYRVNEHNEDTVFVINSRSSPPKNLSFWSVVEGSILTTKSQQQLVELTDESKIDRFWLTDESLSYFINHLQEIPVAGETTAATLKSNGSKSSYQQRCLRVYFLYRDAMENIYPFRKC